MAAAARPRTDATEGRNQKRRRVSAAPPRPVAADRGTDRGGGDKKKPRGRTDLFRVLRHEALPGEAREEAVLLDGAEPLPAVAEARRPAGGRPSGGTVLFKASLRIVPLEGRGTTPRESPPGSSDGFDLQNLRTMSDKCRPKCEGILMRFPRMLSKMRMGSSAQNGGTPLTNSKSKTPSAQ